MKIKDAIKDLLSVVRFTFVKNIRKGIQAIQYLLPYIVCLVAGNIYYKHWMLGMILIIQIFISLYKRVDNTSHTDFPLYGLRFTRKTDSEIEYNIDQLDMMIDYMGEIEEWVEKHNLQKWD